MPGKNPTLPDYSEEDKEQRQYRWMVVKRDSKTGRKEIIGNNLKKAEAEELKASAQPDLEKAQEKHESETGDRNRIASLQVLRDKASEDMAPEQNQTAEDNARAVASLRAAAAKPKAKAEKKAEKKEEKAEADDK